MLNVLACRLAADLGSFVGLADPPGTSNSGIAQMPGPIPNSPFKLPIAYQESKERKVLSVTELRQQVKSVRTSTPCLHFVRKFLSECTERSVPEKWS